MALQVRLELVAPLDSQRVLMEDRSLELSTTGVRTPDTSVSAFV